MTNKTVSLVFFLVFCPIIRLLAQDTIPEGYELLDIQLEQFKLLSNHNGKLGLYSGKQSKIILAPKYETVEVQLPFIQVSVGQTYCVSDTNGQILFEAVGVQSAQIIVTNQAPKRYYFCYQQDSLGYIIDLLKMDTISHYQQIRFSPNDFNNNYITYQKDEFWWIYNPLNNKYIKVAQFLVHPKNEAIWLFGSPKRQNFLAQKKLGGKWTLLNVNGKIVSRRQYEAIRYKTYQPDSTNFPFCVALYKGKWSILDDCGKLTKPKYDTIRFIYTVHALGDVDGKLFIINSQAKRLHQKPIDDIAWEIATANWDLLPVKKGNYWGVFSMQEEKMLTDFIYEDYMIEQNNNSEKESYSLKMKKNGKWNFQKITNQLYSLNPAK